MAAQQGGGPAAPLLGAVGKSLLGVACLQLGRTEEALVWMKPGQEELAAVSGTDHPLTALFALNLASALHAAGRVDAAREIVERAEPVLLRSLGADAPTFVRVKWLKASLSGPPASAAAGARVTPGVTSSSGTRVPPGLGFFS
jgi:hypothetical protein